MGYNVKLYDYNDNMQIRYYHDTIPKREKTYVEQYDMVYDSEHGYMIRKRRVVELKEKQNKEEKQNIQSEESENSERSEFMIEKKRRDSMKRAKNKIYEISRANNWEWFITLTFNPTIIDSTDYDRVKYIVSEFFHAMRKQYAPDLKYLVVPELHKDGKKYHFHGILSDIGRMVMVDSGNVFYGKAVYNLQAWHFGFSTATQVTDTHRVASYITKYITKELCQETDGRHRYLNSSNCNRPRVTEYEMTHEEYQEVFSSLSNNIGHMKTVKIPYTRNKVEYIEIVDI